MSRFSRGLLLLALLAPAGLAAQEPTMITGRVLHGATTAATPSAGQPIAGATVGIPSLNISTQTNASGAYTLMVPASRATGQTVQLTASQVNYQIKSVSVRLVPGRITQDFTLAEDVLQLQAIVVTGQGTQTTREKLGVTVTSVNAAEVVNSQEPNLVGALAGKAPGVTVTTSSGEPGAGSYIQIRGANTIYGGTQPLIVVDGMPINNDTYSPEGSTGGTVNANRAIDLNPNDIQNIEILKGPAAGAIYGSRAASGVILITTKSGKPGANRVSLKTGYSISRVNQMQPLQTRYGQGLDGSVFLGFSGQGLQDALCLELGECDLTLSQAQALQKKLVGQNLAPRASTSWGPALKCTTVDATAHAADMGSCQKGVDFFDHTDEIFRSGQQLETNLTMSGGSEKTTYYLSVGRFNDIGVIDGNSDYSKTSARLKGTHSFSSALQLSGNFMYTDGSGDLIQQGSNISGLLLGTLRTPPEFNNCLPVSCYLDPNTGLHRSYRYPNPTQLVRTRGYDNPFWVAREIRNTTDDARSISTVELNYQPIGWLTVNGNVGADITDNNQAHLFPKSSSTFPSGQLIRANYTEKIFDGSAVATATRDLGSWAHTSLALGGNLNQDTYKQYLTTGQNLIQGADQLDFTVTRIPDEYFVRTRTSGVFSQLNLDLWDQLFLTGALRLDGSNTFGAQSNNWFLYPKFTAAWNFTDTRWFPQSDFVNFGKLRFAYGVTGKQPPAFTNITGYTTTTISDGWIGPNGLETIYRGNEGVIQQATRGNEAIRPEKTSGIDAGVDLAFFQNKLTFGLTYYNEKTRDVILDIDLPRSTGFSSQWINAASIDNNGWEATLGWRPIEARNVGLSFDAQWAMNNSCVRDLAGTDFIGLNGFEGSVVGLYRPDKDANGNITQCYEYNTFYGVDFIRFGRGITVGSTNIDQAFPNAPAGAIYVGPDGFPLQDPTQRPFGNSNPDWTGGLRTTLSLFKRLSLSALVDTNRGSRMWNGTRGALYFFGAHKSLEPFHGGGQDVVFGQSYLPNEQFAGPGAGKTVNLNWSSWFVDGIGSGFTGPFTQFVENSSFVKLRDVSIGLNIDDKWFRPMSRLGFSSADLMLVGRNLKTWTDYTGIDPESNLTGQSPGRGLEYFNNPRVRAWTFTVTLNR